jgi:hypothetical protein
MRFVLLGLLAVALTGCSSLLREADRGAFLDAPAASSESGEELVLEATATSRSTARNQYILTTLELKARDGSLPRDIYFRYARISLGGFGSALIDVWVDTQGNLQAEGAEGFKIALKGSQVGEGVLLLMVEVGHRSLKKSHIDATLVMADKQRKEFALTRRNIPVQ